jgi:hypothetical protein
MKEKRPTGAQKCVCSKCGFEAHTIPGTHHRRCPGRKPAAGEELSLRPKIGKLAGSARGKWASPF